MCISNKYILISKYTGIGKQFIISQRTRGSYSELLKRDLSVNADGRVYNM